MNWQSEVIPFLEKQDYQEVIKFYEQKINTNQKEISNYWYLGLAYLLEGKEEEAQMTWFLVLSQGLEESNQELVTILAEEALNKVKTKEYLLSLKIRETIREIVGEDINNLLHIVNLEILLEEFKIENLIKYNLIELVKNSEPNILELSLLLATLKGVLNYAWNLSTLFAEAVLIYTQCDSSAVFIIVQFCISLQKEGKKIAYAIDLLKICNTFNHNDINVFINLYNCYQLMGNYDQLIEVSNQLCKKVENNFLDLFVAQDYLLESYLNISQWDQVIELEEKRKLLLEKIIQHKEEIYGDRHKLANTLVKDTFITCIMNFLYLQDNPSFYRKMFNQLGKLFQEINQMFYSKVISYPNPKAKKVLKIGYIAHTIKNHSVGYLFRWLIVHHDPTLFNINLYLTENNADNITEKWFKPYVSQIFVASEYINELTKKIEEDEIDILVDLDSASFNLNCIIMSMKPAPIQVTWLGLDASGIPNIDYFMADSYVLPENAQNYYSERIWRLPNSYVSVDGFEIGNRTLFRENLDIPLDSIIFLNPQSFKKINPSLIDLQMQILKNVPNSYLMFKTRGGDNDSLIRYIYSIANRHKVARENICFIPKDNTEEIHRANLAIADVVLDTYPYNGATTTLETLWMEIPLVTRVGEQFAARNSYTFMINAGITEGIAFSDEEYVEWGIKLGNDENLRKEISWKLRQSKKNSPLWNGKQFTREMEKAYQQMWDIYVNKK